MRHTVISTSGRAPWRRRRARRARATRRPSAAIDRARLRARPSATAIKHLSGGEQGPERLRTAQNGSERLRTALNGSETAQKRLRRAPKGSEGASLGGSEETGPRERGRHEVVTHNTRAHAHNNRSHMTPYDTLRHTSAALHPHPPAALRSRVGRAQAGGARTFGMCHRVS